MAKCIKKRYKLLLCGQDCVQQVSAKTKKKWNRRAVAFLQDFQHRVYVDAQNIPVFPNDDKLRTNSVHVDHDSANTSNNSKIQNENHNKIESEEFDDIENVNEYNNNDDEEGMDDGNLEGPVPSVESYFHYSTDNETLEAENSENPNNAKKPISSHNIVMFEASNITVGDVSVMIASFALKFNICNAGRTILMEMFKKCAGSRYDNIHISNYRFNQLSELPTETIKINYYCSQCYNLVLTSWKESLNDQRVTCANCNMNIDINFFNDNYFLTIDLKYQLKELIKSKKIREALKSKLSSTSPENIHMCDITDGQLYKYYQRISDKKLSINFNVDGAPLFHKSKKSMWPLQVILNDLPPNLRFKNVILVGLMIVKKEPSPELMNLYLKAFVEQIIAIQDTDFIIDEVENKTLKYVGVSVLCCSVDSVARAVCQNRIQHNGYFACSYCYIRGEHLNNAMCFPFGEVNDELRTQESHVRDVADSLQSSSLRSRGVKGPSVLMCLPDFDMVWSFAFDVMHTVELGVTKFFWELMKKNMKSATKSKFNQRLMNIQPPHDLGVLPKDIYDFANYKAKHWRSLLLYYSIPIGNDLIFSEDFNNYARLVKSIYILSTSSVTEDQLNECEIMLMTFVANFEMIHGKSNIRFNMHMLLHIVQAVRMSGPLWTTSNYPYEGNIYNLKQLVNGPKGVDHQIIKKTIDIRFFQSLIEDNSEQYSETAKEFSESLFFKKMCNAANITVNGVTYCEIDISDDNHLLNCEKHFRKCISNGTIYTSTKYNRTSKWNDTFILLKSGVICQICDIILTSNGECYFLIKSFITENLVINGIVVSHVWKIIDTNDITEKVPIVNVASKMVFISCGNERYASKILNHYCNL